MEPKKINTDLSDVFKKQIQICNEVSNKINASIIATPDLSAPRTKAMAGINGGGSIDLEAIKMPDGSFRYKKL